MTQIKAVTVSEKKSQVIFGIYLLPWQLACDLQIVNVKILRVSTKNISAQKDVV